MLEKKKKKLCKELQRLGTSVNYEGVKRKAGERSKFMKILNWNVRGLGDPLKGGKVKEIILKLGPEIVMLQETKLESFEDMHLREVWDSRHKDYVFLPSSGASGGMVLIWTQELLRKWMLKVALSLSLNSFSVIW